MNLLILTLLVSVTVEPIDSLGVKTSSEAISEGDDEVLQYTFGMDTYRAGFNKGSISTNTLEEHVNTANGNLELKIKLLSLPMRGNKDYDLYLTYRGSPLSVPGMKLRNNPNEWENDKKYGFDRHEGNVADFIYEDGALKSLVVTSDMGNCGLGWNVMPGEVSANAVWSKAPVPGLPPSALNITDRIAGFINLNGGLNYSTYKLLNWGEGEADRWFIKGKRNWGLYSSGGPFRLKMPEYGYKFKHGPVAYPNPEKVEHDSRRRLYLLTERFDRNGNYIKIDWYGGDPPRARIPEKIFTPTDTCYIYGSSRAVDSTEYCLWDFWVIDSIVRNVNGDKFKINFYYHQSWFEKAMEYWYGHAFILLDSVEFLKNNVRLKPPYRFLYEETGYNKDNLALQGELIEFTTPDSVKYEYMYDELGLSRESVFDSLSGWTWISNYRRIEKSKITLPDAIHLESQGASGEEDGVCEYVYSYGPSVGPFDGEWWDRGIGGVPDPVFHGLTFHPIYSWSQVKFPEGNCVKTFRIDSQYVDENIKVLNRLPGFGDMLDLRFSEEFILPSEREELYGLTYKKITSEDHIGAYPDPEDLLKLECLYWNLSEEIAPAHNHLENPLHPVLKYKASVDNPVSTSISVGDTFRLYEYIEYDKFDNEIEKKFSGHVRLTEKGVSSFEYWQDGSVQSWEIGTNLFWDDLVPSDNWGIRRDYAYTEQSITYADAYLYNLVSRERKYEGDFLSGDLINRTEFVYDGYDLADVDNPPLHDPNFVGWCRGNLTKKTEWINENDEKRSQYYWYDSCGNIVKMEDYMGYSYEYYYDPVYVFPDSIISPDGLTMDFNFDREGNLTSITDKSGITDSFEYDIYGRTIKYRKGVSDNMVLLGRYEYDDYVRKVKEIKYNSANSSDTTIYSYDGLGRIINVEQCAPTSVVLDYIYNGNGQKIKETQPRFSNVSLYGADYLVKTFDGLGRVTEIEYPESSSEPGEEIVTYEYDRNLKNVIDEKGYYTTLINDASGNLDTVIDALGNKTYYFYDINGILIEIEDAEGKNTYFEYDWLGNLVRREGPDRGEDLFEYYPDGQLKFHWNNAGDKVEFEYDQLGRIKKKIVNSQVDELYWYDGLEMDGLTYDPPDSLDYPEGKLTGFENPDVKELYFYDRCRNLVEKLVIMTTGEEKIFQYAYDLQGRLTELKYPDGYKVNYQYDKLGNISLVDINNWETVNLSSTAAGLTSSIGFPGDVNNEFSYTPRNWMAGLSITQKVEIPSGGWTLNVISNKGFEYSERGELLRELEYNSSLSPTLEAEYTYDPLGRLKHEHRYDTDTDHDFTTYDKVGNRKVIDGKTYTYFDDNGKKTNKLMNDGEFEYTYDEKGCLKVKIEGNDSTHFYYDPEGRLTGAVLPDGSNGYKYYYKGQQRIREEKLSNIFYSFGGFSYTCKLKSDELPEAELRVIFLDEGGDECGTKCLGEMYGTQDWKEFSGIITQEELPSGTFTAELVVKRLMGSGGELWVDSMDIDKIRGGISGEVDAAYNYFYDNSGNLIMVEDEKAAQYKTTKYIYAGNRLIAKLEGPGVPYFYHLNRIGSPIMITDVSGNVVKEKKYEAFGNLVWEEGIHDDNREFTSKEKDPTGFHYFGARYYYGNIGRFLSPDPHTLMPENLTLGISQSLNPYVYCRNNPIKYVDLFGLKAEGVDLIENMEMMKRENRIQETWTGRSIYESFIASGVYQVYSADNTRVVPMKDYYFVSISTAISFKAASIEGGVYFLVDPHTYEYYWWIFVQVGPGISAKGSNLQGGTQIEVGRFSMNADQDPANISLGSITLSGFINLPGVGVGIGGQFTKPFSGGDGWTKGLSGGVGAGLSIMYTHSFYQGKGGVVPEYVKELLQKK